MNKDIKKAAAIMYNGQAHDAPQVVAAGQDEVAEKIIALAQKNGIHIHKDGDLVEILSKVPVGHEIPEDTYRIIAEILAFVYQMNKQLEEVSDHISPID